ncbi:glycosyltransferase [Iodobacter sp. LRB]|uniref:glycosyltransferase family 2 protein n=1 Tax=unclassified Iodobacter TaxID=235634 RepID=UPI000C11E8D1|nr:glycosyltransferase [Iodobacter sp. BJB302]PHV03478.1 hypothetical protein CSQ88_01845 [Iodobacter sp. BJB302]
MNNYQYKVSVCIFVYNHENYISDCLMSVLSQDIDGDIEILVGDDCSTDATEQVIRGILLKYPGRITYFRHEKNIGSGNNIKFLVQQASGEFVAHLDGDDYWLPGKLSAQIKVLKCKETIKAVFNNSLVVTEKKAHFGFFNNKIPEIFDLNYLLECGNFLHHSTLLYRLNDAKVVLDMPSEYIDYRIHLGFAMLGDIGFVNEVNSCYRLGSLYSLVRTVPNKIRILYTDSILSVGNVKGKNRILASILSEVILSSIKCHKISIVQEWYSKFRSHLNYFMLVVSFFIAAKKGAKLIMNKFFLKKELIFLYSRGR